MIEPFNSEAEYRAAIDATILAATRELRIFDGDLMRMALDETARHSLIATFLSGSSDRHLYIVLHDTDAIRTRHPRLLNLIRRHATRIEIRQTPERLRHLADRFILADGIHGTIRFHENHARGKRVTDDDSEIQPVWQRFDELWEESLVCTPGAVSGL